MKIDVKSCYFQHTNLFPVDADLQLKKTVVDKKTFFLEIWNALSSTLPDIVKKKLRHRRSMTSLYRRYNKPVSDHSRNWIMTEIEMSTMTCGVKDDYVHYRRTQQKQCQMNCFSKRMQLWLKPANRGRQFNKGNSLNHYCLSLISNK